MAFPPPLRARRRGTPTQSRSEFAPGFWAARGTAVGRRPEGWPGPGCRLSSIARAGLISNGSRSFELQARVSDPDAFHGIDALHSATGFSPLVFSFACLRVPRVFVREIRFLLVLFRGGRVVPYLSALSTGPCLSSPIFPYSTNPMCDPPELFTSLLLPFRPA